ncbi:hypothetical protein PsYK624_040840 [Phanerochaete sordida]|uniref:Uncharacterized protein n=1 Tax=Phanerochaete sordida TaxID=48140 RepID=A0A9P3LA49_9APHY|nr:hypothetical protein PsYK624_040840 [Phanerochaete sordida]
MPRPLIAQCVLHHRVLSHTEPSEVCPPVLPATSGARATTSSHRRSLASGPARATGGVCAACAAHTCAELPPCASAIISTDSNPNASACSRHSRGASKDAAPHLL